MNLTQSFYPAEFVISLLLENFGYSRKYLFALDAEVTKKLTEIAKSKQITSEALANVWLIEKIKEQTNSNQQFRINVSTGFRIEGFSKKVMNSFGMNDWILVDSCIWATNYRINECTVLLTNL